MPTPLILSYRKPPPLFYVKWTDPVYPRRCILAKPVPSVPRNVPARVASLYEYSFAVKGPMLWNRLPKHVKGALTLSAFKGSLGDFLNQIPDMPPSTGYSAIQECTITLFWIAPSKTNESVFLVQSCSYRIGLLQWSY